MKKLMICALTLLPLIILLIMFVSGAVISLSTYIYVQDVEFVNESVTLNKTLDGELAFKELQVNVFPMQANNKEVEFWSGDEQIVTIDENGKVVAVDFGETYVYVKSKENETKQASCKVTVTDTKIHRLKVSNVPKDESLKIIQGETFALEVDFIPKEASFTDLVYKSSDESILAVGQDGTLNAMPDVTGEVTITVYSKDNPNAIDEFKVYVRPDIKGISFVDSQSVVSQEKEFTLPDVKVDPVSATDDATLSYVTSNSDIAIVKDGKLVFKKAGTVELIVREKGLGEEFEIRKTYTSSFGYYTSVAFTQPNAETIAYEAYEGKDAIALIAYTALPVATKNETDSRVSFESSNENVIKIVDGSLEVVGGGNATITVTITINEKGDKVSASKDFTVTRKATELQLIKDGEPTKVMYTLAREFSISNMLKLLPSDHSDRIVDYSSQNDVASVTQNGTVTFNKAGKAYIEVTAEGGISATFEIVYIEEAQNPQELKQGAADLTLTLPHSSQEQKIVLAPYIDIVANSIEYELSSSDTVSLEGCVLTITDKGSFRLFIKRNGEIYSTLNVAVSREVESISVSFQAVWSETDKQAVTPDDVNHKIYTSASIVEFAYTLAPLNATLVGADIKLDGDLAILNGNRVCFSDAGSATLTFTADDISYSVTIESTNGLFDSRFEFADDFAFVKNGDKKTKLDFIKIRSPLKADFANITLKSLNDVAKIEGDVVTFVHGGIAQIEVSVKTTSEEKTIVTKVFKITVQEEPTSLDVNGNGVVYCNTTTFDLDGSFKVTPSTANYNNDIEYKVVSGSGIATINGSVLQFVKAGEATIYATTKNEKSAIIKVIYVGKYSTLGGGDVEIGTSFVFMPSDTSKLNQNDHLECDNSNISIVNGIVVTINDTLSGGEEFTLSWGENTYSFKGIVKATCIKISFVKDQLDSKDASGASYITALEKIDITASVDEGATYKDVTYSVSDESIASYSDGKLIFKKAGEVTLTATEKYGKRTSITVYSTCGAFDSIKYNGPTEFDYDLNNNHIIDFTEYFVGTPSQAVASVDTIELRVYDEGFDVEGLSVTLPSASKNFTLEYSIKGSDEWNKTKISVVRKATDIKIDGEKDGVVQATRAFIYIKTLALPEDATYGKDISFEIVAGNEHVESLNGSRLQFKTKYEDVVIEFTLKNGNDVTCKKTVKFRTSNVTPTVSFADEKVIAPAGIWFAVDSGDENLTVDFSSLTTISEGMIVEDDDVNKWHRISTAGTFEFSYKYNESDTVYRKTIIVTSRVDDIQDVTLSDKTNVGTDVEIAINKGSVHYTASIELNVNYAIPTAINANGSKVVAVYSTSDESIATITKDGKLTFHKMGMVTVAITVSGQDFFELESGDKYTHELTFNVHSTMGGVSTFEFVSVGMPSENIIVDNTPSIKLGDYLTHTAPTYGELSAPGYKYTSSNPAVATVGNDGIVKFVGTGKVKLTVTSVTSNSHEITFNVDKYADKIAVRETKDENSNIRETIYTNAFSYQIYAKAYSENGIASTLNQITYRVKSGDATVDKDGIVKFKTSGKAEIELTVEGNTSITLTIVYVEENILSVRDNTEVVTIESGDSYVLDVYINDSERSVNISALIDARLVGQPDELGVFKANCGGSATLVLTNEKSVKINVNQAVTSVNFNKAESGYDTTVNGIISANKTFDLKVILGAYYLPTTAYKDGNPYVISYAVNDESVATVSKDGVVTFVKAGIVKITVEAGGKSLTYEIESTFGLAKTIEFTDKWKNHNVFNYSDKSYTLVRDADFTVYPSDVTNEQILNTIKLSQSTASNGAKVFVANGLTISFERGGADRLVLTYISPSGEKSITTAGDVRISKSVDGIDLVEGKSAYIVTTDSSINLAEYITVKGDDKCSPYIVRYSCSKDNNGNDIVTLNSLGALSKLDGVVRFKQSSELCTLTVSIENFYTGIGDWSITVVVRKAPHTIVKVENNQTSSSDTIILDGMLSAVSLAPNGSASGYVYQLVDEEGNVIASSDVIKLNEYGDITMLNGGYAYVKVSAKQLSRSAGEFEAIRKVFVHKTAQNITLDVPSIATSNSTIKLLGDDIAENRIYPQDARYEKVVEFVSSDSCIASVDGNGVVKFVKAGKVSITAYIKYGDVIEATITCSIFSSCGNATELISNIETDYTLSNVGENIVIAISNILPGDLKPEITLLGYDDSIITATAMHTTDGYTVIVTGKSRGKTTLTIDVSGYKLTTSIEVRQKSEYIEIKQSGNVLTNANTDSANITTLVKTFKLISSVYPLNANNTAINWTLSNGISIAEDGTVTISGGAGTYTLIANADDGNSSAKIVVEYIDTIGYFDITYGSSVLEDNQQLSFKWNVNSVTFSIKTYTVGVEYARHFTVTSSNGYEYNWNEALGQLTISLPDWSSVNTFDDTITLTSTGGVTKHVRLYRSGIKSIVFGDSHDNDLDTQFGLQQIRVTGNKSYRDGAVQTTYKMPVTVEPSNIYTNVRWTSSDSLVTIEVQDGYVLINFSSAPTSSFDEVYNDDFSRGAITISATDIGNTLSDNEMESYIFHLVNAVNVYDQEGYLKAGSDIVLQVDFGHDDQATQIANGTMVRLEGYNAKNSIYGNGHLMNIAYRNTNTDENSYKNYSFITFSVKNLINTEIQGANFDSSRESYHMELSNTPYVAYCEIYNMYRGIENGNTNVKLKRSLIRSCKECATINTTKDDDLVDDPNGTYGTYLEDMIIFDAGSRALELHSGVVYIKGFLDVYNFQNKDALKEAVGNLWGGGVFNELAEYSKLIETANGEEWCNIVALSAKGKDRKVKYYDESTDVYKDVQDYNKSADQEGLVKVGITYAVVLKFSVWSYPVASADIHWTDQYMIKNGSVVINDAKMISTVSKLWRTNN